MIAALLVLPALVASVSPSLAAPSQQDVEAAKQKVLAAQDQFAALTEQYNQAVYELQQAQQHLDETLAMKKAAEQQAATARDALSKRAVQAYTDMGSQYESLLSAGSMSEFSDRLEFLGAITQTDADLASQADAAAQQAAWASQEYDQAVADHQQKADQLQQQKQAAENALAQAQQLSSQTQADYNSWVQQQQALQQAASTPAPTSSSSPSPPPSSGGGDTNFNPPPASGAGATAAAAAMSVLGAPYVFGAAGPSSFDCSGLTMWAWAQAGVSLPHSAAAQWASFPKVSLSQVQPGDIIYYDNFGPHVAIYVGGGTIVHARHPGPGGQVQTSSMMGYDTPVGAVRPG